MKILSFIPNPSDGTSFYRGTGVLSELHKIDKDIQITQVDKSFQLSDAKGYDLAFFQRPDSESFIQTMAAIKALNIPVVVDYDDYLLEVPSSNRYHQIQKAYDNNYEYYVKCALKIADKVIVSTQKLKELLLPFNKNISVVKNAIDDYCFSPAPELNKTSKKVLWRGSATHQADFDYYGDEILKLISNNPDYEFIFWTDITNRQENLAYYSIYEQLKKLNNVKIIQAVSPLDYFQGLIKMKPCLILAINKESNFNLCKSDIAKLEGFLTGALCAHDNLPEWNWGVINQDKQYFFEHANNLLSMIRDINNTEAQELYLKELEIVKENRLLSDINFKRLSIFRKLVK
jgi:hypothetical protein